MSSASREFVGLQAPSPGLSSSTGFASMAPEVQAQMYRRLGGMGLLYSFGWAANFLYHRFSGSSVQTEDPHYFWHLVSLMSVLVGFAVYESCRRGMVAARFFPLFATAFQVLGGLGIYIGAFHYLQNGEQIVLGMGRALGIAPADTWAQLVKPLDDAGIRLLYLDGVTWVSVWLLTFPLLVPMPMSRTVIGTLLTAAVVPGVLLVSKWAGGAPEVIEPWVDPYILESTIPTFICAGMAIIGSRVVYKLAQDLSRAKKMGNYELVERIGAGGMGEVWRAEHRMLARPAAIKLIRPEVLGGDARTAQVALKRFEREVQLTTQLVHPHTITIFDYGQTPDGAFYYVMEFLEGIDLESCVKRFGPVPAGRAIAWLVQACGSLDEAHSRGMIHRDIKPANLYACRYGVETDFLKVLDFGLVKGGFKRSADETRMTVEQQTIGTPAYLPPEIALGGEADPRSDLYALGCVAYWLLTGQTVFEGETAMQQAVDHARTEPVPPSARVELAVPDDFEALVMQCLRKDPGERPSNARELRRALETCRDAGAWSREESEHWWSAHLPAESAALTD